MNTNQNHIDDLIGKYLASEATRVERSEVESWIEESPDNRAYFKHFQIIFERASHSSADQEFDTDEAWIKLKGRLSQRSGKTISISSYWPVLRVAATILFVAGAAYLLYQWGDVPVETVAYKADDVIVRDTLPDGSRAILNRGTTISYAYNPRSNERRLQLSGEAFFDVVHDEEKPFIIESQEVLIEDLGTKFNVRANPEGEIIEVYVESGEVAFYTIDDPGLNLIAGETGVYDKTSKSFARLQQIDTNKLAYSTGVFLFRNADLATIIDDLNAVYDTKVRLSNETLRNCRLNVSFRNENIDDIVEIIAATLKLSVTKQGEEYVLSGVSCGD